MIERRAIAGLILLFGALIFVDPPGARLVEPDESRYAEIPREMLVTGDFITPRLNGAHYFEKPPFLYWANAASIALFGRTELAARLPTRLAALGTAVLLIVELGSAEVAGWGAWSALIFLSAPLGWGLARFNLTDGMLTFWLTVAFLALRRYLREREEGGAGIRAAILLGVGTAFATLTKGLIGIVFPGLVLVLWAAIVGRWRRVWELLRSPAPLVFLVLALPWFILVQRANPQFARIFFIREHLERFATPEASRPGPIYYFVATFVAGFLPWTVLFPRGLAKLAGWSAPQGWRAALEAHRDELFFALWFFVILVFFSLSHSKLVPYILPAFPAAAALTARGILGRSARFAPALAVHAVVVTLAVLVGLGLGVASGELRRYGVTAVAGLGGSLLVLGAWIGAFLARREGEDGRRSIYPTVLGWAGLYAAILLAFPRVAEDLSAHDVALAAARAERKVTSSGHARVVAYKCYPQIFPWELGHPITVAAYVDELGSDGVRPAELYWSREELLRRWNAHEPLIVVTRWRTFPELRSASVRPRTIASNRKYVLVTNTPRARTLARR